MKRLISVSTLLVSLLTACSPSAQKGKEGQINVLPAFENQTELKVSHLGKTIRYIPLETTDSSLIHHMQVGLLEDKIIVASESRTETHCFLFDRQSGKFIRVVSQRGNGPRDYSSPFPIIYPETKSLYFKRLPGTLLEFSQEGE